MVLSDLPLNDNEPADLRKHRSLLIGAGIGGLLIAVGFATLVFLLIYRISERGESTEVMTGATAFSVRPDLPVSARTRDIRSVGGRIMIDVDLGSDGRLLLLLDPATGRETGRFLLPPAPPGA